MSNETPIYRETTSQLKRVFKLNQSTVEVEFKSLNADGREVVKLVGLNPEPVRFRGRQIVPLRLGGCFLILGIVGFGLGFAFRNQVNGEITSRAMTTGTSLVFLGVLILSVFGKKIEVVQFKNSNGVCLLSLMKSGADKALFESFVTEIIKRIHAANNGSGPAAETGSS